MKDYRKLFIVKRKGGKAWNYEKDLYQQEGWNEHAQFMNGLAEEGFFMLGGPTGKNGETTLIIDANDETEIRNKFADDSWSKMDLLEIAEIIPWTILLQHKSNF